MVIHATTLLLVVPKEDRLTVAISGSRAFSPERLCIWRGGALPAKFLVVTRAFVGAATGRVPGSQSVPHRLVCLEPCLGSGGTNGDWHALARRSWSQDSDANATVPVLREPTLFVDDDGQPASGTQGTLARAGAGWR
jgi:hypothetical protein